VHIAGVGTHRASSESPLLIDGVENGRRKPPMD
jgi:hypothetical protein